MLRKGGKIVVMALAPRTARAIDRVIRERLYGGSSCDPTGNAWTGTAAAGSCAVSPAAAGLNEPIGPHTLRHAFITAALDAGVPLRDVQEAASHADPRTTMRYDRARVCPDRHTTYIAAAYLAAAAR